MSEEYKDKKGRAVKEFDILKVFHFKGARWGKNYYMYKIVIGGKAFDIRELAELDKTKAHRVDLKYICWKKTEIIDSRFE